MENTILQRFRLYIKIKEYTIKSYSEEIDSPEGTINNMFSRGTNPSTELLVKILKHNPKFSLSWLLVGVGEMEIEETQIIGKNALAASNALLRLSDELNKKHEKKVPKTTQELINKITELSAELAIEKEKNRALEEKNKNSYLQVAEPTLKYGK